MRLVVVLLLLLPTYLRAQVDFAPHNMTDGTRLNFSVTATNTRSPYFGFHMFDGTGTPTLGTMTMFNGATGTVTLSMAAPQVVTSYAIRAFFDLNDSGWPTQANRAPKNWTFLGADKLDGSWTTLDTQTNQTGWTTNGETRTYAFSNTHAYRHLRLSVTANNGDTYCAIGEAFYYAASPATVTDIAPHNMTANNAPSPLVASASTELVGSGGTFGVPAGWYAWLAFYKGGGGEGAEKERWIGNNGTADWVQMYFGGVNRAKVSAYTVCVPGGSFAPPVAPKGWTFIGSDDASAWTTLDTESNQTSWGVTGGSTGLDCRIFPATSAVGYKYIRLNITTYQTGQSWVTVGEIYLWGTLSAGSAYRSTTGIGIFDD